MLGSFRVGVVNVQLQQLRLGHRMRGRPPIYARSLKERLEELNYKDELYTTRIDIGLPNMRLVTILILYVFYNAFVFMTLTSTIQFKPTVGSLLSYFGFNFCVKVDIYLMYVTYVLMLLLVSSHLL